MRWPRLRPWWAAVLLVLGTAAIVYDVSIAPRKDSLDAMPGTLRTLAAATLLFGVTGLGLTRLLLARTLGAREWLWVLPTGACATGLAMTVLGFAGLPFALNLAAVAAAGSALSAAMVMARGWPSSEARELRWPLLLAVLLGTLLLSPMVVGMHEVTVTGTGSDAHMAAGSAQFLQNAHPTGEDLSQPVDRMPLLWKSKYPIYYAFAGVSALSVQETWQVLTPLAAFLGALAAIGMFLLARDVLGARLGVALCAMGFAGADRMVLHTVLNPYFNQTWGHLAMPFSLVLAWWLVKPGETPRDRRGTAVLLGIFVAVLAFAYPLALPFAAMPLVVFAWRALRRRRAEGKPVLRALYRGPRDLLWIAPLLAALAIPLKGVNEKVQSAAGLVLDSSESLKAWAADLPGFVPVNYFINLPDGRVLGLLIIPVAWLAIAELRRQPRALFYGLGIVLVFGLYEAWAFRQREFGWYFHFKILAFVAPLLLVLAAARVGRWRRVGPPLLAAFAVLTAISADIEVEETGRQLGKETTALASWAERLPPDASIRLDMKDGLQLWGAYFLSSRRVCSAAPMTWTDYPYVAFSIRADYVVVHHTSPVPKDALVPPLFENIDYALYELQPILPGPDKCSYRQDSRVQEANIPG